MAASTLSPVSSGKGASAFDAQEEAHIAAQLKAHTAWGSAPADLLVVADGYDDDGEAGIAGWYREVAARLQVQLDDQLVEVACWP